MTQTGRIRIGNQTSFSALSVTHPFEYAVASGFDAFEWFPDRNGSTGWNIGSMDNLGRKFIKDTATEKDIDLAVHAPESANPMRTEARGMLINHFMFAGDIGATLLNIHLFSGEGVESYARALIPFIRYAAKVKIKLSVENTPLTGPEDFNEMFAFLSYLKDIDIKYIGMCLDVGHANLTHSTRNDYLKFVDRLDPAIPLIHVHLHENYGDRDSHLTVFTGPSGEDDTGIRELMIRLKKRNFSGSIILEQWPEPRMLLNKARDRLYGIIAGE